MVAALVLLDWRLAVRTRLGVSHQPQVIRGQLGVCRCVVNYTL